MAAAETGSLPADTDGDGNFESRRGKFVDGKGRAIPKMTILIAIIIVLVLLIVAAVMEVEKQGLPGGCPVVASAEQLHLQSQPASVGSAPVVRQHGFQQTEVIKRSTAPQQGTLRSEAMLPDCKPDIDRLRLVMDVGTGDPTAVSKYFAAPELCPNSNPPWPALASADLTVRLGRERVHPAERESNATASAQEEDSSTWGWVPAPEAELDGQAEALPSPLGALLFAAGLALVIVLLAVASCFAGRQAIPYLAITAAICCALLVVVLFKTAFEMWRAPVFVRLKAGAAVLGQGASGPVVAGVHRPTSELVAIKCNATEQERRLLAALPPYHNVVRYLGVEQPGTVVMERAQYSLQRLQGFASFELVQRLAVDVLHGLRFLHEQCRVVHRDIKPGNILVFNLSGPSLVGATLKIGDFGSAEQRDSDVDFLQSTQEFHGTRNYASPEALDLKYGGRSDVWSFGKVCSEYLGARGALDSNKMNRAESFVEYATRTDYYLRATAKDLLKCKFVERVPTATHEITM
eukprot:TRINITY_DN12489_c0_g1_i1.p1 TRINITY_DN12489_c0_g1~~TRINITY_DN12489_c0_g1_i1.p1  ORF type:complete len:520 (+),score=71.09 TRINITY_DN12489_c0_g1_i1:29-1588(+)